MVAYRTSVAANMNLIGEQFFSLSRRYRVQCDWALGFRSFIGVLFYLFSI